MNLIQQINKKSKNTQRRILSLKFGTLSPVKYLGYDNKRKYSYYECKCDCGNIVIKSSRKLLYAKICNKSCPLKPNKQKFRKESWMWRGYEDIPKSFFTKVKREAKEREIEFNLTIEELWDLFVKQNKKCALSGVDLKFQSNYRISDQTASIDRIDSSKGYTLDNVQWVHKIVNFMKQSMLKSELISWCKRIVDNN